MKIIKLSTLPGAEKFGSCNECGKPDEAELYRIVTECTTGTRIYRSSLCLCKGCMAKLQKEMEKIR